MKIKESIKNNYNNIIATCGYLPLPDDNIYIKIENNFDLKIEHILIMNKNIDEYKKKIIKRQRQSLMDQLIKDYYWRESNINLYNKILVN